LIVWAERGINIKTDRQFMNKKQENRIKRRGSGIISHKGVKGEETSKMAEWGIIDVHKSRVERDQSCISQPMASKDPRTDESVMVATTEAP
jgi:hypothetical protein